jgi:hypothetical protein
MVPISTARAGGAEKQTAKAMARGHVRHENPAGVRKNDALQTLPVKMARH